MMMNYMHAQIHMSEQDKVRLGAQQVALLQMQVLQYVSE